MIRLGLYARYEGEWYEAARTRDKHVKLVSRGQSVPEGFVQTAFGSCVKTVEQADIAEMEIVRSFAVYRGETLEIAGVSEQGVALMTDKEAVAQKLGMQRADRHDYRITVPMEQVGGITEKRRVFTP